MGFVYASSCVDIHWPLTCLGRPYCIVDLYNCIHISLKSSKLTDPEDKLSTIAWAIILAKLIWHWYGRPPNGLPKQAPPTPWVGTAHPMGCLWAATPWVAWADTAHPMKWAWFYSLNLYIHATIQLQVSRYWVLKQPWKLYLKEWLLRWTCLWF